MTDYSLLDELNTFVRARAARRLALAEANEGPAAATRERSKIRLLADAYDSARRHPGTLPATVDYLRSQAMRDRNHPDYKPEWTI